jgi:hypothetical protein
MCAAAWFYPMGALAANAIGALNNCKVNANLALIRAGFGG